MFIGRVLTALATPLGFALAVLIWTAFSLRGTPRRWLFAATIFAALFLAVSSSGCGSRLIMQSLEHPFAGARIESAPAVPAIVVLGGYLKIENRVSRPVEI